MARESALWKRLKDRIPDTQSDPKSLLHISRIENSAGVGQPDVEGCHYGRHAWIELKSVLRPKRPETIIRPKLRDSQRDWHKFRTLAGGRSHWVLIQVGERARSSLYLIPGKFYEQLYATEGEYELMSVCNPDVSPKDVLLRAFGEW